MADFTIERAPWADGVTVGVYPAVAQTRPGVQPSGAAVDSEVVASRTVAFHGLSERVPYVAYAAGITRNFLIPGSSSANGDRDRLADLESRAAVAEEKTKYASITNPIGVYSGAVGDGVTDNTLVIQAWVDWVEANLDITRVVYVPAGNFVTAGISSFSVSVVGEEPTRALQGHMQFGSRLIHKAGSTLPLIDMQGGATVFTATQGWERVENLSLQGRQKQNITQPKASIVSASDRTHFTVAIADLPTAPSSPTVFPFYGLCLFFDANGDRLGSGVVQSVNTGTGVVTLQTGTDNYTGITGSGNLLTATEKVAFSGKTTYDLGWSSTVTNIPDSAMIGPPAILTRGLTKYVNMVDIRDFHCSIVMQENILHLGKVWSHNHVMAGLAIRAPGSTADVWAESLFFQGRKYEGMGATPAVSEPPRSIGVIDNWAMHSLCGMWGIPSTSHFNNVTCEAHMHAVIDIGGMDTRFDYLNSDGTWKEPIVTHLGRSDAGHASAVISIGYLQARTLQAQYLANFTAPAGTYVNGERTIIGIATVNGPRKWHVGALVANKFASDSPNAFDFDSVSKISVLSGSGTHEITIDKILFQGAVVNKQATRLRVLSNTKTWDPASVAAGAQTTTTITVTGAALGDPVGVGFDKDLQGMRLTGYVSAADTVTVVLANGTAGALDLASGTLRATVDKWT